MSSEFYDLYNSFEQPELFDVLLNPDNYQPEAVECAKQVLREKRWTDAYSKVYAEKKVEQRQQDEEEQTNNVKLAEYYRKAVDIKMQHHRYSVLHGDGDRFEERLAALNIEYFKEDPTLSRLNFNPEYQAYYFKTNDIDAVDEIGKELGIFSAAYDNTQAQQWPYVKLVAIITIGFIIFYSLYELFSKK